MDSEFPLWYRAAAVEPKDDRLRKRWRSVEQLAASVSIQGALDLIRLFVGIMEVGGETTSMIQSTTQKADASFIAKGNDNEVRLLAGAAIACSLTATRRRTVADAAALALVSVELAAGDSVLVPDVLTRAYQYLNDRRSSLRAIDKLPGNPTPKLLQRLKAAKEKAARGEHSQAFDELTEAFAAVSETAEQVRELARQQQLFREESNVLWWMNGAHSRDFDCPFGDIGPGPACIVAAKELVDLTRSSVGPVAATAFLSQVLTQRTELPSTLSIAEAITGLDFEWAKRLVKENLHPPALDLSPVCRAIDIRVQTNDDAAWATSTKKAAPVLTKVKPEQLARRFYEELLLHRLLRSASDE